jgi:hypothetical protein
MDSILQDALKASSTGTDLSRQADILRQAIARLTEYSQNNANADIGKYTAALTQAITALRIRDSADTRTDVSAQLTKLVVALNAINTNPVKQFFNETRESTTPVIGGGRSGRIPAYASGTVVPPNNPHLALLGDNTSEPEIVSPLSTMQKAVADVIKNFTANTAPAQIMVTVFDPKSLYKPIHSNTDKQDLASVVSAIRDIYTPSDNSPDLTAVISLLNKLVEVTESGKSIIVNDRSIGRTSQGVNNRRSIMAGVTL